MAATCRGRGLISDKMAPHPPLLPGCAHFVPAVDKAVNWSSLWRPGRADAVSTDGPNRPFWLATAAEQRKAAEAGAAVGALEGAEAAGGPGRRRRRHPVWGAKKSGRAATPPAPAPRRR